MVCVTIRLNYKQMFPVQLTEGTVVTLYSQLSSSVWCWFDQFQCLEIFMFEMSYFDFNKSCLYI